MQAPCSFFVTGISLRASACSYSSNSTKIGRNFSVQVLYRSQPLAGRQIELSTDPKGNENRRPILTTNTNKNGLSEFSNVKPGPYHISIREAAFPQSTEIVVDGRRPNSRKEKLTFEWPGFAPLSVRSVSGLLNRPVRTRNPLSEQAHPTFAALGGVKLTRLRAVTNSTFNLFLYPGVGGALGYENRQESATN
jgi:hypothetical protein